MAGSRIVTPGPGPTYLLAVVRLALGSVQPPAGAAQAAMGISAAGAAGAAPELLDGRDQATLSLSEALLALGWGEGHGSGGEDSANSGPTAAEAIGNALLGPAGGAPALDALLPGLGDVEQQDQGDGEDGQEGGQDAEGGGHGMGEVGWAGMGSRLRVDKDGLLAILNRPS